MTIFRRFFLLPDDILALIGASFFRILGLLAVLGVFAFFALSETAIFSLQKVDREALKEEEGIGEVLRHLLARPHRLLAALLIGAEISSATLSTLSASLILGIARVLQPQ